MIKNALFGSTIIVVALFFWMFDQLSFLWPYKSLILAQWVRPLSMFLGLLWLNLAVLFWLISRKLLLKDTGRKLAHMEMQLRGKAGGTISEELAYRIGAEP